MNYAAVYHRAWAQYCYPRNEDELIINIKTGYDVDHIWLVSGDPYLAGIAGSARKWEGEQKEIEDCRELAYQRWWTITVKPSHKRLKYYFILKAGEETCFYFENGFLTKEQLKEPGRMLQYFIFPWMNESDISRTPGWVSGTVWYQIFPERFCNGDPSINPPGVLPWETRPVTERELFGGDLAGICSRLDYLKELGITGIYLTPIFDAPSNHKYNTKDYFQIDPSFGDKEAFRRLVEEAHSRGIRIMLDMVFNHCGHLFPKWLDVVEKGPQSPWYHWFMVNSWPFDKSFSTKDGRFYSFAFFAGMPKLNTNNPETAEYLYHVCAYWVDEFDVDGLRFDVGNEVSHSFIRMLRSRLKQKKPDIYLLGEIWHEAGEWLEGDQYDGVMNYPLTESINDFWLDKSLNAHDFACMINRCYSLYREQNNLALFNMLDSHDTDRLFTRTGENMAVFYQQLAVLFTMPGSPCIYYGTEIAMPGGHDPDCRRCMPWTEVEEGKYNDRLKLIRELIRLRKEVPGFSSPQICFYPQEQQERVIIYEKKAAGGPQILVMLNCSEKPVPAGSGRLLFSYCQKDGMLLPGGVCIQELEN